MSLWMLSLLLTCACVLPAHAESVQETLQFTLEEAVKTGIENSIDLKQVENEINLQEISKKRAKYNEKKLDDGKDKISYGRRSLSDLKAIEDAGASPDKITLPNGHEIPAGPLSQEDKEQLGRVIQAGEGSLSSGEEKISKALKDAASALSSKLDFNSMDILTVDATGNILTTSANVSYEVTKASYDIYKNQLALLIQKNYYDVLKGEKMLQVKDTALARAQKQYQFVKDSFEEGMASRDDMLLADIYCKGKQTEYQKAQGDLKNAYIELKKNLNIPLETQLKLTDVLAEEAKEEDLKAALLNGFVKRLEMKKSQGEVIVYDLNFEEVSRTYPDNTFQYKEANLLKEKARINFSKTKLEVENSIRQSYETVNTMGEMLNTAKTMIDQAKESVEIAEFKYKEGFGVDSVLMKKTDTLPASGTIMEVLVAEENLASIKEKVVEIMYGYNLAKMKFYNDAGYFVY